MVTRVEFERTEQCRQMDCPVIQSCQVKWGRECVRQSGSRIPRFKGHGSPYRQASRELERPLRVEPVGTLGTVIWLNQPDEDERPEDMPRHPLQRIFDGETLRRL